ncbi:MAG: glycosyl hydrolase family 3 [Lachnospiraceae bacterium]|nr:glycosyl hydrolase family 3 [Lachnospiraceae bacterium]
MAKVNLKEAPFYLAEEEIETVQRWKESLSPEQMIGQLFCLMGGDYSIEELKDLVSNYGVGSILYRPAPTDEIKENYEALDQVVPVPLLKAANLEEGGSGGTADGTLFGWPMTVGATGDESICEDFAKCCAKEGRDAGINWTFSPVSDMSINPLNPITNVRAFGDDLQLVLNMTKTYATTIQKYGVAACAKHFPGDGVDFRDQHLHPSYNHLSADEWYKTYGSIYRNLIDNGLLSIMTGHIVCPEVSMNKNPSLKYEDCMPGSLSKELLTGVLREEFGFNGVITTDATIMGGYTMNMPRKKAVVQSILAGADMLVFSTDFQEDYDAITEAVQSGAISKERLEEAVTRILALKAVLCLRTYEIPQIQCEQAAQNCAQNAITLVKDTSEKYNEGTSYLPITVEKYPNIRLILLGEDALYDGSMREVAVSYFKQKGFDVYEYHPIEDDLHGTSQIPTDEITVYLANEQTASNRTTVRLNWCEKHALDIPRFINEQRSVFISLSNPYHLMDIPRIPIYINGYSATKAILIAALDKLTGAEAFQGKSPVDAFCGLRDTRI